MSDAGEALVREISHLSNKLRRRLDGLTVRGSYTAAQGRALHFLVARAGQDVFQRDVEEEFSLRPPTATELLKKMEEKGLITRQPMAHDGRLKKIVPTPKALECQGQVLSDLAALEADLSRGIPREDLEVFLRVAAAMERNLSG